MQRHVNIPVFIPNLGCPHKCVFCDQRAISGHGDLSLDTKIIVHLAQIIKYEKCFFPVAVSSALYSLDPDMARLCTKVFCVKM